MTTMDIGDDISELYGRMYDVEQALSDPDTVGVYPSDLEVNTITFPGGVPIVIANTPPGPVTSLLATASAFLGNIIIDVSWVAPVDGLAIAYDVELAKKNTSGGTYQVPRVIRVYSTQARFENLDPSSTYGVRVLAVGRLGAQSTPNPSSGYLDRVTVQDTTLPLQVTGLVAIPGPTGVTLTWDESTDADVKLGAGLYQVDRATNSGFTTGLNSQRTSATIFTQTGLTPGTTYWYRVSAIDSSGNQGPPSTSVSSIPGTSGGTDGSAPASSPTAGVTQMIGGLFAKWPVSTNADPVTYEVHLSTATGFVPGAGTKVGEIDGTAMFISTDASGAALLYGTNYYLKIITKDRDGSAPVGPQAGPVQVLRVGSSDIIDGTISSLDLANNSVINTKIASGAIDSILKLSEALQANVVEKFYDDMSVPGAWSSNAGVLAGVSIADGTAGGKALNITGAGSAIRRGDVLIPFDPDVLYRVKFRWRKVVDDTVGPNEGFYGGVAGVGADRVTWVNASGANLISGQHYIAATDVLKTVADGWQISTGYIRGYGATSGSTSAPSTALAPAAMHPLTRYLMPLMYANWSAGDGTTQVELVTIEVVETGVVTADNIFANSITAEKLSIGSLGSNHAINGGFEDVVGTLPVGWQFGSITGVPSLVTGASALSGGTSVQLVTSAVGQGLAVFQPTAYWIPVVPGDTWYLSAVVDSTVAQTGGFYLRGYWFQSDKATSSAISPNLSAVTNSPLAVGTQKLAGQVVAPADARWMRVQVLFSGLPSPTTVRLDSLEARPIIVSAAIADGAITTPKLIAGAVTAEKLTVGSIGPNAATNGSFVDVAASTPLGWFYSLGTGTTATVVSGASSISGANSVQLVQTVVGQTRTIGQSAAQNIPVTPGDTWNLRAYLASNAAQASGVSVIAYWFDAANVALASPVSTIAFNGAIGTAAAWYEGTVLVPANARFMRVQFQSGSTPTSGTITIGEIQARQVVISAQIADGAITTPKIQVGAITAASGIVGSLDAGIISVGTLAAARIGASTITTDKLTISAFGANEVVNGSFEEVVASVPIGWTFSPSAGCTATTVTGATAIAGNSSVQVTVVTPGATASCAITQPTAQYIPVIPGEIWRLSALVNSSAAQASGFFLRAVWLQADKVTASATATSDAVANQPLVVGVQTFQGQVTAPSDARWLRLQPTFNTMPTAGTLKIDEVTANRTVVATQLQDGIISTQKIVTAGLDAQTIKFGTMSGARITTNTLDVNSLVASTLTSKTITIGTGGALSIGTPPTTGLLINDQGLRLYSGGVAKVVLDAPTGAGTFTGTISGSTISGGSITSATLTSTVIEGSTIRTGTSTSARLELLSQTSETVNGGVIRGYNAGNSLVSFLELKDDYWLGGSGGGIKSQGGECILIAGGSGLVQVSGSGGISMSGIAYTGGIQSSGQIAGGSVWSTTSLFSNSNAGGVENTFYNRALFFSTDLRCTERTNSTFVPIHASAFPVSSSRAIKKNIKGTKYGLSDLMKMTVFDYDYRKGVKDRPIQDSDTGLIADEIHEIYPGVVSYDEDGTPSGIDYGRLTPLLIKSIQELTERVREMENA